MSKIRLLHFFRALARWLFWPGVLLISWGELTPKAPDLGPIFFGWDKAQHFTAYFGLASMATLILGRGPKLVGAFPDILLFSGLLEMLQGYTGRDPDIFDFIANSIGALCGLAAGLLFLWWTDPRFGPLVGARRNR